MSAFIGAVGFGLVSVSIIALGAVGFTLQLSVTNVFNLAFGQVMTVCAFTAYVFTVPFKMSIWVAMLAAAAAGAILSVLLQLGFYGPFLRKQGGVFTVIMVSLALGIILQRTVEAIAGATFYSFPASSTSSIHIGDLIWTPQQLAIMGIAVLAMGLIHYLLRYTKLGKAMRATAAESELARNCGIDIGRIRLIAWGLSGVLCGLAGVALVLNTVVFDSTTGSQFLLFIVAAAVVGGIGQPYGAMLGALCIGLASEISALWIPDLKVLVAFVLLVAVLLLRPAGMVSGLGRRRTARATAAVT